MYLKPFCFFLAFSLFGTPVRAEEPETVVISPGREIQPAVPRPIPSNQGAGEMIEPGPMEPEMRPIGASGPDAGQMEAGPQLPDAGPRLPQAPVYNWNEAWHEKPVAILGIDITNFPEVMAVVSLRKDLYTPVDDVRLNEIKVSEDEAPQQITSLAPCIPDRIPGDPLSIMFLIDASGSMQEYIDVVQSSASRFVDRFAEDDRAGVVAFSDHAVHTTQLTDNKDKVKTGLFEINPRGFTALYDSVDMGTRQLANCQGKKAIILVTDGKDDDGTGVPLSRATLEGVIEQARMWRIPIFAIGIGDEISLPALQSLARKTGGEFLFAPSGEDVDALYSIVARRLGRGDQGYYQLTYRTSQYEKDGTTRTIIVKYQGDAGAAQYPAPRNLFWPLSKVFD
ncbi:MAG: VWA domain-containing protein [Candidatus Omnitrophica bacterium]|nr:VWA domain-containing protein [Candidatus Omnitrophota bacterium]